MPTKNPRLNVVLDKRTAELVDILSKKRDISKSALAKELIEKAIELEEDFYLAEIAETRNKTLKGNPISEEKFWKPYGI
ncbi:MAG: antitoxin, RHH family protein [Candidatus Acidulodesulfobacterium ferriphilum]|uniref:Antitoxin, RHH family protein n=1 Tax=Candidatus Acidulodesulfobacterium ferriphilum TaxID=2597223 RepID=A0A519BDI5_9DELT|nr:MAG: antitoxin, RHH family protein [Candidatus Acidulodesulfobacterium ferriphilum]